MKRSKKRAETDYGPLIKWVSVILLIASGLILGVAALGITNTGDGQGFLVNEVFGFTRTLFGVGAYLVPILVILLGLGIALKRTFIGALAGIGIALIVLGTLALLGMFSEPLGGMLGTFIGGLAKDFLTVWGAAILLLALIAVGVLIAADVPAIIAGILSFIQMLRARINGVTLPEISLNRNKGDESAEDSESEQPYDEPVHTPSAEPTVTVFNQNQTKGKAPMIPNFDAEYDPPPVSLLSEDKGKPGVGDIKANANIIKRTFQNFGISVEMDEVSVGPTVTRYAIKPAEGVRLSKVVSLQSNLELALAAHPVRLEAPIPGKSLVGIEVPNATKATVGLGGVLSAPEWGSSQKPLLAAVGRDITGTPHYVNIAKMPHGLVAGATGSGKSVAIHALITSLLYRNGPNQLRFIMIDPKRVELTLYNGIPHLLTPVITDPRKSILALKWAAKEMDRRYGILEQEQVRDIESYHNSVLEPARKKKQTDLPEAMPYIVIVVDELADIMQTYPRELEAAIVRLAQMSRAVGIHLILSTQRPSVNVITGLIKANVPTRMALQVASQIDSRTIIDGGGAELLLGAGDMLYLSADMQKPIRLQTAYIAETEVKKIVSYIKQNNAGSLDALDLGNGANGTGNEPNDALMLQDEDVDDDLYEAAKAAVEEAGKASTSYLQRKLRVGYGRAARLIDLLHEKGVVGPADGARPREVLSRAGAAPSSDASDEVF
ncbi:MAG: DNA segregation ATPase FtsK/SpoIIIE, S-DNA-T family [Parcubacteria bacterium C7867-001]|nr:MAG: DNA segregation ATPase FtsK/SpoIIIE, S-DNA-T family [Parcubacteria bacterium C7867-001]